MVKIYFSRYVVLFSVLAFSCHAGGLLDVINALNEIKQNSKQSQAQTQSVTKSKQINPKEFYKKPSFNSIAEERNWIEKNQAEILQEYKLLSNQLADCGKELLITAEDSQSSVDQKYQNSEDNFQKYINERNRILKEFEQLIKRCYIQELTMPNLPKRLTWLGDGNQVTLTPSFFDQVLSGNNDLYPEGFNYVGTNGCKLNEKKYQRGSGDEYSFASPLSKGACEVDTSGVLMRTGSPGCASINLFGYTYEKYVEYVKSTYDSVDSCKEVIQKQNAINTQYELDKAKDKKLMEAENIKNAKKNKEQAAKQKKEDEIFQKNLKVGDKTVFGEVVQISGDQVKVRAERCIRKIYETDKCLEYGITDKWLPRKLMSKKFLFYSTDLDPLNR